MRHPQRGRRRPLALLNRRRERPQIKIITYPAVNGVNGSFDALLLSCPADAETQKAMDQRHHSAWQQGQAEIAAGGGADRRSAKNTDRPHESIARSAPLGLADPLPPRGQSAAELRRLAPHRPGRCAPGLRLAGVPTGLRWSSIAQRQHCSAPRQCRGALEVAQGRRQAVMGLVARLRGLSRSDRLSLRYQRHQQCLR
jgi:hypothetical protein